MEQVRPVECSHFKALHFDNTSTFSSVFPIPSNNEAVRSAMSAVPDLVDSIFLMRGSNETRETDAKGAIPLAPMMAKVAIDQIVIPSDRVVMESRHFVLGALTQGVSPASAMLRIDRGGDTIRDLSLIVKGRQPQDRIITELRGAINGPYDDVYEVESYGADGVQSALAVSSEVVDEFIHALRELRAGRPVDSLPTEASLLELLEGSASYTRFQSGSYGLSKENGLQLTVERLQRIKGSLARTCSLYIKLQERTQTDSIETVRNFSVTTKADSRTRRKANLDYLIRDLTDGKYDPDARSAMFENISTYLRRDPAVLFGAMQEAAEKLASFE